MQRHYTLLSLLTAFVIIATAYGVFLNFKTSGLPVAVDLLSAHTAVLNPIKGVPLPVGIRAGDRLDLAAQPIATRIVISIGTLTQNLVTSLPLGHTYDFVIERGKSQISVPVTTVNLSETSGIRTFQWISLFQDIITAVLALLVVWRGHNRAAVGMAIWTLALAASGTGLVPLDGPPGLVVMLSENLCYLLARVGFYVMADAVARPILSSRVRNLYLGTFVLILIAGAALYSLGGPMLYALTGWAGGLLPRSGLLWSASYLVPIMLLFASYQHANTAQRLRLRWMLWSGVVFLVGIVVSNTPIPDLQLSIAAQNVCQALGIAGFLYAVLRHRVVDVSVFLDRTLVYGVMTALVVGVLAAVNSLVQHAALGTNAGVLLQVVVPLSLGIVLTRLRTYLDKIVERVFFRKKYLADKALRRFAEICGSFEQADELMATAIANIRQHLRARGVAIYERRDAAYASVRQAGDVTYPVQVGIDDTAMVAARANQNDIDLSELPSSLGGDGYVFPMTAHGEMQHVLVCANRPGEHYPADDRALLAHVTHEMGMALYALRMRAQARVVEALVKAPPASLHEIQTEARALLNAATAG